jgi:CRISPR-associated endonuclease Csn1
MKILGLDLGTNSIGWAVVEKNNDENFKLIDKGVRIFQEGVKIEKGKESSKAASRTGFRSARRIKFRRKLRKIELLKVLSSNGYCPELSCKELEDWRYKKIYPNNDAFLDWQKTDEDGKRNPYYFRAQAVEQKFDLSKKADRYQLGRALYHMVQRRGFLSNRLEGTKENEGTVKKSITEISNAKGNKTLGQFFYGKYLNGEKIRDVYTHREEHYLAEFNAIMAFQNIPQEMANEIYKAIFFQRPLKSQKGTIGKCVFETNKSRCSASRPEFEEYRMLCFVNNIKIKSPDDDKLRPLNANERGKAIARFLLKRKYFDFEDIAKHIAPRNQYKYYKNSNLNPEDWLFNYQMKTTVSGCPITARFIDLFGEDFQDVQFEYKRGKDGKESVIDINDIWHILFTFDSDEKLSEFARNRLGFNNDQVKEFLNIQLPKDYASLSLKAIKKILPYLQDGLIYSHAVFLANMESLIPSEIWSVEINRRTIGDEIYTIIKTQNEEKQIVEIVNGIIKNNREEGASWSEEASEIYKRDLTNKTIYFYGRNKYEAFSDKKKLKIENSAFFMLKKQMQGKNGLGEFAKQQRIDDKVKAFLTDNFDVSNNKLHGLYHPSAIEIYKPAKKNKEGMLQLGSPMISSMRNPMAMRALHQLRKVINELIKNEVIDSTTKVNIEMARDLMNANERKALQSWQRDRENKLKEYAEAIREHFVEIGNKSEPSEDEILKYQLWEEQKHKCIYTGDEISVSDFLGSNPAYDIEHTIPRSLSLDNSQENKTLCQSRFNRSIKRNRIPYELRDLIDYPLILERIHPWKEKFEELEKQVQKAIGLSKASVDKAAKDNAIQKRHRLVFERNYWKNKYQKFILKDITEGFKNSQLVDTGIITKYSRLYIKTIFDKVYTVKGSTVADFRKIWGIQKEYEKKVRINHMHHCIDAITIACITKENYEILAKFYHEWEEGYIARSEQKPYVDKPWDGFVEDLKTIENEVLVSHYTPDVLSKQSKKKLRKRGKIQKDKKGNPIFQKGDTVRGSLHQETFYGAIEQTITNKAGIEEKQIKYVVRKPLDLLEDANIKHIVDNNAREIVMEGRKQEKILKKEIETVQKKLNKADEHDELIFKIEIEKLNQKITDLYTLPNKNGNKVPIKKVRIYTPTVTKPIQIKEQRDKSKNHPKAYKEHFHVANDGNYLMAIYEGKDYKGKIKRDIEIVNNLKAGEYFKLSVQRILKAQGINKLEGLVHKNKMAKNTEVALKAIIKTGTMVLLWKNEPNEIWTLSQNELKKRMYKVVKMNKDGRITLKFHQEARNDEMIRQDFENVNNLKAPKSLTNGESFIDFENPFPKLLLSPVKFNFLVEKIDFVISPTGRLIRIS